MIRNPVDVLVVGNHVWPRPPSQDHVDYPVLAGLADRLGGSLDVITTSSDVMPGKFRTEWGSVLYMSAALGAVGFVAQALIAGVGVMLPSRTNRLVVSSDVLGGVVGAALTALLRLPHVIQIQGHTVDPGPEFGGRMKRRLMSLAVRFAIKHADLIRCLNRSIEREVLSFRPTARTVVLGSRVDVHAFTTSDPREPVHGGRARLLSVGALEPRKNHVILLRVLKSVTEEGLDACLSLAGDGGQLEALQHLSAELGLEDRVHFLGRVGHARVLELLGSHDLFLFPSISEGQPRAVLEAMAAELPVVASRIPGIEEIIDDNVSGVLVAPDDAEAWVKAVRRLLLDNDLAKRLAGNGRIRMLEEHDFESSVDRMAEIYRSVMTNA